MNKIKLISLSLKNFKGIKSLKVNFGNVVNIKGKNATGKSTIFDSFCYLLFGKDSQDKKDFDIKTLDIEGNVIHNLEHQVTGILDVNGRQMTLSKIYKEKWTKSKGSNEKEFTGNDTLRYINGVPVSMRDYEDKVKSIIDEQLFKLISNPLYFSNNLKWQERRKVILDITGDIDDSQVASYKPELGELVRLLENEDFETFKKQIAAKRKMYNDEIKSIPFRIDECNNSVKDLDFDAYAIRKKVIKSGLDSINNQILDRSSISKNILEKKNKLYTLKAKIADIEFQAEVEANKPRLQLVKEVSNIQVETGELKQEHLKITFDISTNKQNLSDLEGILLELKNEWQAEAINIINLPEDSFVCPICNRPFDADDKESKIIEMTETFNLRKAAKLTNINTKGQSTNLKIKSFNIANIELLKKLTQLNIKMAKLTTNLITKQNAINTFIPDLNLNANKELAEVKELELELERPISISQATVDLNAKYVELVTEMDDVNETLAAKENNVTLKARIKDLEIQEKTLGGQIAYLEKQEFLCQEFMKTKVILLESAINNKFRIVRFKMFDKIIKDDQVKENCVATVDGVPYESLNSAAKINAGIDIINTLSEHYQVSSVIFLDNSESINNIIETNAQLVKLTVSEDKVLKIETED